MNPYCIISNLPKMLHIGLLVKLQIETMFCVVESTSSTHPKCNDLMGLGLRTSQALVDGWYPSPFKAQGLPSCQKYNADVLISLSGSGKGQEGDQKRRLMDCWESFSMALGCNLMVAFQVEITGVKKILKQTSVMQPFKFYSIIDFTITIPPKTQGNISLYSHLIFTRFMPKE